MTIPSGFDYEQIKYNVYAFGRDVCKFTAKRDRAKTEKMKKHWQRKLDEQTRCLNDNLAWLAEIREERGR